MKTFDVIVLGVGGMGSAAAYYLAKRKKKVLGLERFNIPHNMGSSHGEARIFRLSQFSGSMYVPLAKRSLELWRDIENLCGEKLLYQTGGVDCSTASDAYFKSALQSCIDNKLDHEVLDAKSLHDRFPAFELPADYMALWQPDSGFLNPEKCITQMVNLAFSEGAVIHAREEVIDWEPTRLGVKLRTSHDTYEAESLVITAGAWSSKFLKPLRDLLVVERTVVGWIQPLKPAYFQLGSLPIFIIKDAEYGCYGFPMFGYPGFRVGRLRGRSAWKQAACDESQAETLKDLNLPENADIVERNISLAEEELIHHYVKKFLPAGNGEIVAMETCLYTNSPDEHFIVDLHPEFPQVSFAAGFTGSGFKFCTAIGEIMADLAIERETEYSIDSFRLERFKTI